MWWSETNKIANLEVDPSAKSFQRVKSTIHKQLVEMIDISKLEQIGPERLRREIRHLATELATHSPQLLNQIEQERIVDEVSDEVFGLGPLEVFMKDPTVSDILVNGSDTVYIERDGRLEETSVVFADNAHVIRIIQRIAARIGRRVDEMSPMVDARLPDGSRVNAIIPPLAIDGPVLSIRRFGIRLQVEDLLANHTATSEMMVFLRAAIRARANILISGGTGAGKTTLLNSLSRFIPSEERLVTIEDSAELQIQHKHVIRLETRIPNLEGVGEYTQRHLVRNSLRMRPDRILLGEVRGPEALDMLQAMNTGHEGSLTTIHANDTRDALARLETKVTMAGFEMPLPVIRNYVGSAIRLIVHMARLKGGIRKIIRISEIIGLRKRKFYVVRDIFGYSQTGVDSGMAVGEFHATGYVPKCLSKIVSAGIELPETIFEPKVLVPQDNVEFHAEVRSDDLIA